MGPSRSGERKHRRDVPRTKVAMLGGGIVLLALAFLTPSVLRAWQEWRMRSTWAAVPCTITRPAYDKVQRSRGMRYWPRIEYRYTFDGRTYTADKFALWSPRRGWNGRVITRMLERYPAGSSHTCWVDSTDPTRAVLKGFSPEYLLGLIPPLPFLFIGVALMARAAKSKSRPRVGRNRSREIP